MITPWWTVCQNVDDPDGPANLVGPFSSWEEAMFDVWLAVNGKSWMDRSEGAKCKRKHFIGRFHKDDEKHGDHYCYDYDRLRAGVNPTVLAEFHHDLYTGVLDRDLAVAQGRRLRPQPRRVHSPF